MEISLNRSAIHFHMLFREEHVGTSRSVAALPGAAAGGLARLIKRSPSDQHQRL
jgi:hypothetical protein